MTEPRQPGVGVVTAPVRRRRRAGGNRGLSLAGRSSELALLLDECAAVRAGELHCVLVTGEPGVGKSRLAAELLARVEGVTALASRAHPMGSTEAFGAWADALDPHLQELADDRIADLCGGFLDDLANLIHRVVDVRGGVGRSDAPRARLLAGLTRVVDGLAEVEPVVVLLDDAHWADASSWDLLRHLARHIDDAPLLVVLTARPAELAEHEVAPQVLFELEQDGLLTRLDLDVLDDAGLRALAEAVIGGPAPDALVEWVRTRSGGNALYAIGLLRALLEEGADLTAPVLRRLPESLAERIAARMRSIPEEQLAVIDLLAVVGRPVSLGDLVRAAERPLEQLAPLLAQLVASRGVVECERGRQLVYELSHPLVRDLVYERIGGARRRTLHRRVGQTLREAGHLGEAARHYARACDPGDAEGVAALLDALREAEAREALPEALGVLGELVDLLPAEDRRWLEVLDVLRDRAEWLVEHRVEAQSAVAIAALRAMDGHLSDDVDPVRRGVVTMRLAHFLAWGLGRHAEAETTCRRALDLFRAAGDDRQIMVAEGELAWIAGLTGDLRRMQEESESLAERAHARGDEFVELQALAAAGLSATFRGRFDAVHAAYDRLDPLAADLRRRYRRTASTAMAATARVAEGRVSEGLALMREAKARDGGYRETLLLEAESTIYWMAGDYATARRLAADAPSARAAPALRRVTGRVAHALAVIESGDLDEGARLVAATEDLLDGRDWQIFAPMSRYAAGLLEWASGRPSLATAQMEQAAERLTEMDAGAWLGFVLLDLAAVAVEAGDPAVCRAAAARCVELADSLARPLYSGMAALTRSWAAFASGDPTTAFAAAEEATRIFGGSEFRSMRAHAQVALARTHADRSNAAKAWEEAARLYEACGALWRRERVLEALRRQGASGRRSLAAALGPDSLTQRERDVARLAARGLSAKEIAAELFVGERTVETHLGNVYAKLGVESKLDLVRRAADLRLT